MSKTEGGQTTVYVNQYYEKNLDTGEVTTHYYHGGTEIAYKNNSGLRYVSGDHLGSTALVMDSAGGVVSKSSYLPFGGARLESGTFDTDKRFTGQRLDDTGLYFYNARYHDATIGRFISADTIVPDPFDPQCLNRYSYVLNNPLKYTDPSGHFLDTLFDIVSIVADVVDFVRNPTSGWGWGSLGADVVCAFVPFVAGGGAAARGAKITTKIVNRMGDASDAVKTVDRTHDYARTIGMSWDVTKSDKPLYRYMS